MSDGRGGSAPPHPGAGCFLTPPGLLLSALSYKIIAWSSGSKSRKSVLTFAVMLVFCFGLGAHFRVNLLIFSPLTPRELALQGSFGTRELHLFWLVLTWKRCCRSVLAVP